MTVIIEDEKGWYFNGYHKQGSEVEVSKSVYDSVKDTVKLKIKDVKSNK